MVVTKLLGEILAELKEIKALLKRIAGPERYGEQGW